MAKPIQKKDHSDPHLETDKVHKDWYEIGMMGKQRGKPKAVPPKTPKKKGEFRKHR